MKKVFILLLLPLITFSQTQIGDDIEGEAPADLFGSKVCLSSNGNIIAISGTNNDTNGSNSGHVRVFENISGVWTQIGSDIDGEGANNYSGSSISLSSNGNILAIGADGNNGSYIFSGHVRVFENISGVWTQLGSDIDGEAAIDNSGASVSLSSDGTILAIGAPNNDANGSNSGHVRVYQYILDEWIQLGLDIDGEAMGNQFGSSVSLSSNGNILAIGAPYNDNNISNLGYVKVFEYISEVWTQIGSTINGDEIGDLFGSSVSLSSDGTILAIGAPYNDTNGINSGHVRVFENVSGIWTQIGSEINGDAAIDNSGASVSLSSDGTILAIGAPYNDTNGLNSGHVRVYKNLSGVWIQIGLSINGEEQNDGCGIGVSLSSNGSVLAIGSSYHRVNSYITGHVRVFNLSSVLSSDTFVQNSFLIYPNPSKESVTILLENDLKIEKVIIYNPLGQIVKTIVNEVINISELAKGSYYLELTTNQGKATKTLVIN